MSDVIELYAPGLNLARSCACGQSFRWRPNGASFSGVVRGRAVTASQHGDTLLISGASGSDADMWRDYFDLSRDYVAIENALSSHPQLCCCLECAGGIHVFNQEPFETLISFIISANNNIKRISGIVERLCALAGEKLSGPCECFSFPSPAAIAALEESQLVEIGAGYRAPYIKRSAALVADGYDLAAVGSLSTADARKRLLEFPGVGPKVADCVLLFSLHHSDAFPVDVWIGRAMSALFFDGAAPNKSELDAAITALGDSSGIFQQYVFQYAREKGIGVK